MTISSFPLDGTLTDSTSTLRQLLLGATAVAGLVFTALGPEALAQFKASTDPLECPTRELRLVRKAGGAGPGAVLDIG